MLSFEHKKSVFKSFQELQEKQISNNRINYVYPSSLQRGKILATQIHPSGNGYVIGKYMDDETIRKKGYLVDSRGWINIKDFTLEELNEIIITAMFSMSGKAKSQVEKTCTAGEGIIFSAVKICSSLLIIGLNLICLPVIIFCPL